MKVSSQAFLTLLIVFLMSCSSAPPKPQHHPKIAHMIEKNAINFGDEVIVETTFMGFKRGIYTKSPWSEKYLVLANSKKPRHFLTLQYSYIKNILPLKQGLILKKAYDQQQNIRQLNRALLDAIRNQDYHEAKMAIKKGAKVKDHNSPLLIAAVRIENNEKIIKLLVKKGVDVNQTSKYSSSTALQVSLQQGNFNNARSLLRLGVNIKQKDATGRTPMMHAYRALQWTKEGDEKRQQIEDFISYLEQKGANREERFADPIYLTKKNKLGINGARLMTLDKKKCFSILDKHKVKYEKLEKTQQVKYPIRLLSPVDGTVYQHTGNNKTFSIMDCRLAAGLVALGPVWKKHGISKVYHMRSYSKGAKIGGRKGKVSGHSFALALDLSKLIKKDGGDLEVYRDWLDRQRGDDPCQADAGESKKQKELRKIICSLAELDLFHWVLTPHYNKAHHDHFHVEIRRNQMGTWFK